LLINTKARNKTLAWELIFLNLKCNVIRSQNKELTNKFQEINNGWRKTVPYLSGRRREIICAP
jgi:hypothetical protein